MTKTMDKSDVEAIIEEMNRAGTRPGAQKAMAKAALTRNNLTPEGRAAWSRVL